MYAQYYSIRKYGSLYNSGWYFTTFTVAWRMAGGERHTPELLVYPQTGYQQLMYRQLSPTTTNYHQLPVEYEYSSS